MVRKLNNSLFTFRWAYSQADEAQVDQFKVFRQTAGSTYSVAIAPPAAREVATSLSLQLGVHKFFLAAIGVNGMVSDPSNIVDVDVYEEAPIDPQPPPPPTNFTVE